MNKLKKIGKFAIPAAVALLPFISLAVTIPAPNTSGAWTVTRIENLIDRIGTFMITIGVIVAIIFIIWGGIKYMTAGGDPTKTKEARSAIFSGLIGAAVILGVGIILSTASALITGTFFGV